MGALAMTDTTEHLDPLALTVRDVAKLLRLSEPTVRAIMARGELPTFTVGRCRRIRRIDLEDFMARRVADGGQDRRPEGKTPDLAPDYESQGEGDDIPY